MNDATTKFMRILVISSYLPYPLHSGGQVRLYNLIKELSDKHEITLICEKRPHQALEDIREVEKICKKVITVPRRKQWSLENMAKSAFSPKSFLTTGHTHPEMQEKIREELEQNKFDLIHVETFYVMQNVVIKSSSRKSSTILAGSSLQLDPKRFVAGYKPAPAPDVVIKSSNIPPIVLVEHNIEYQVYQRFVDRAPSVLRPLLSLDVAKIKREEEEAWKRADALVAVSGEDRRVMEEAGLRASIVANGVDVEKFVFKPRIKNQELRTKKILFMGDFTWIQNRDSAEFIIKDIFPKIKEQLNRHSGEEQSDDSKIRKKSDSGHGQNDENIKLWIVGREIPGSIMNLTNDPDVMFDVESSGMPAHEIFQQASVLLAPIRVGGGTSYKILESMACGTPVVTMPMSAHAIHARDGEHVMIGGTAEELAEKTVQLLQDSKVYERISKQGRELIERNYSWKKIAKILDEVYKETTNKL